MRIALVALSSPSHYTLWNALAAESLAGDLRGTFGDSVRVTVSRVRSAHEMDEAVRAIRQSQPDIVGLSVECGGVDMALALARGVLTATVPTTCPRLVFGGKIPTYFPEIFLSEFPASIAVLGEGELPFRMLISSWILGIDPATDTTSNIAYWRDGLRRTKRTPPDGSLLIHPPATDTVGSILEPGVATMLTQASRGCSWSQCTYCTIPSFRLHERWEPLPWKRTLAHLEALVGMGVREFEFCDDEFLGGRGAEHVDRAINIARDIRRLGQSVKDGVVFRVFLIPHTVYRNDDHDGNRLVRQALDELRNAGMARVYFGVESGSPSQMKRYCRGTPLQDVIGALGVAKSVGVGLDCGFIMFDPRVTVEELQENTKFFRAHDLAKHNHWPFRPLVANEGAPFGRMMARNNVQADPGYMCYRYRFHDPDVQIIYDAVDTLSSETRSLFYTLKVVSKTHFDPLRQTRECVEAKRLVVENAMVYLDLIEDLALAVGSSSREEKVQVAVKRATNRIGAIVRELANALSRGIFHDQCHRLMRDYPYLEVLTGETSPSAKRVQWEGQTGGGAS